MPRVKPAECFPVGDFIRDELEARGWTARECAMRMGGNVDADELALELHMAVAGSKMTAETAECLAKAFGTSAGVWLNLDRSYREYLKRKEEGNTCRE